MTLELTVRGARGSIPVAGRETVRYGGHTTCFDADLGGGTRLVVDCGTGLRTLTPALTEDDHDFHVLITHYHLDHLQGLPFFEPLFDSANTFTFYGAPFGDMGLREAIANSMEPPLFPVALSEAAARKEFIEIDGPLEIGPLGVTWAPLNHPQGVVGYRLQHGGRSLVVATDHEAGASDSDQALRALAQDADVLIHDAQYTPEEYDDFKGWGHSTWRDAAAMAQHAGVGRLVLTSHDPARTDDDLDAIVTAARAEFPYVEAAFEGLAIRV